VRILIADDHELIRKGIWTILAPSEDLEVCGEAATGQEAVEKAIKLTPDLVIMDVAMPVLSGLDATREIRKVMPDLPILIVSMHDDSGIVEASRAAGARGFITKMDVSTALVIAVHALLRGQTFFHTEDRNSEGAEIRSSVAI
jgi:two-component system response regulator NreC